MDRTDQLINKFHPEADERDKHLLRAFKAIIDDSYGKELTKVIAENTSLKLKVDGLESRIRDLELNSRRNNLIITGIPEAVTNLYDWLDNLGKVLIEEIPDVEIIHRLGKQRENANRPRPALVRFVRKSQRDAFWRERFNLNDRKKGGRAGFNNIFLEEDFPPEIRKTRRHLLSIAKEAKKQGYERTFVRMDTISVGGVTYKPDGLADLPSNLHDVALSCKRNQDVIAFFHKECPLSNHHMASFKIESDPNGVTFNCTEQFIMVQKALAGEDYQKADHIMSMSDPVEMLNAARFIKGLNRKQWENDIEKVIYPAIKAKFAQNKHCLDFLLATENRQIAEASRSDFVWGTGTGLWERDALESKKWSGQNKLGKMLMRARSELSSIAPEQTSTTT